MTARQRPPEPFGTVPGRSTARRPWAAPRPGRGPAPPGRRARPAVRPPPRSHPRSRRRTAQWFAVRAPGPAAAGPGTLAAIRPATWPEEWTSGLTGLVTVVGPAPGPHPAQDALAGAVAGGPCATAHALRAAGVLPAPAPAARPASVLSHHKEGPEGQFALF